MTWRAFIIGLLAVALIAVVTPYNDFEKGNTFFTGNHFPAGAVAILLLLTLGLNVLLKLIRRSLRQSELMLIWCMMIVSCTVPASGLMRYLFSIPAAPAYYAPRSDLPWEEHVLKDAPDDLLLTKAPHSMATKWFFEGTPGGERVRIPWGPWTRPLIAWGIFVVLFWFSTFCICGMLRKQWVEVERLIFPVARVPLEFTEDAGTGGLLPGMVKNRGFVVGVIVTLVFAFVRISPVLTGADQGWTPSIPLSSILWGTPLGNLGLWTVPLYPIAVGFAFLVPSDISLSIWFFLLFVCMQTQCSYWLGTPIQGGAGGAFMAWQQAGAYFVFVVMMLWSARRHLANVAGKAFGWASRIDDSDEPIGYRFAFWGFVLSFFGMALWFTYYKMNFLVAVALLLLMFTLVLGLARLVSQGGVFFVQQVWQPPDLIHAMSGGRAFSATATVVAMMQNAILITDAREVLSAHAMNALRISSVFERRKRLFLPIMFVALGVSAVICAWATLRTYYSVGGYNIANSWGTISHPITTFNTVHRMITSPVQSAETHYGPMALGAAIMFVVTFMRGHFYWWPIHPLGFMLASSYAAIMLWFSFLLGWLAKVLTLKFAGGSVLRIMRSFFLGVIIAESFAIAVSTVLGLFGVKLGFIFLPG